ncbi:formate dehydrogenase subunit gamma [Xylophilus sp. GOD-11R]|uniref:formate dehydrogenase subunit gamma n=1 Tax=Xylophilus sp. GOD-11R TaxID=3089814 RepID=UPI00298CD0BB|nr:formate dehydrogenase subunit gamma [Xylophilus sp. GOD-11R]WPB57642.1 formate dehydrogenase subunit gamma [Xylophilus sp. GOD-11R]
MSSSTRKAERPTGRDFARAHELPSIERYTPNERSNHWITAICFVLLALSGLALFHPAMFWLTALFGGGPWTRILHPFIGVVMFVSFMVLVIRFWHHNFLEPNDTKWMRQIGDVLNNREERVPPVGRYNAGQKILFWVLLVCMLGLLLTGIVMWRSYFSHWFPIDVIRAASLLHAFFGFVIVCSIIVHIYAGIWVKGSIRAMTQGWVTYAWARKHHAGWYEEIVERERGLARDAKAPPKTADQGPVV